MESEQRLFMDEARKRGQQFEDIFPETFDNKLATKKNHESSQQESEPRFKLRKKQLIQV